MLAAANMLYVKFLMRVVGQQHRLIRSCPSHTSQTRLCCCLLSEFNSSNGLHSTYQNIHSSTHTHTIHLIQVSSLQVLARLVTATGFKPPSHFFSFLHSLQQATRLRELIYQQHRWPFLSFSSSSFSFSTPIQFSSITLT